MIPTTWSEGNIIKLPKVRSHGHLDRYYFTLYTKQEFYITAVTKFFFLNKKHNRTMYRRAKRTHHKFY